MERKIISNNSGKNVIATNLSSGKVEYELELLHRHLIMLNIIVNNEPIGIIRLSNLSNFPQHKVRYSLRILEQEGLIKPSANGAITTEKFKGFIKNLNQINFEGTTPEQMLNPMIEEIKTNPNIEVFTSSTIEEVSGFIGNFEVVIAQNSRKKEIEVGTIISTSPSKTLSVYIKLRI